MQAEDHEVGIDRRTVKLIVDACREGGTPSDPWFPEAADWIEEHFLSRCPSPERRYSVRVINPNGTFGIRDNWHPETQVQAIFTTREQAQEVVDRRNGACPSPERDTVRLVDLQRIMREVAMVFASSTEAKGALAEVRKRALAEFSAGDTNEKAR
jgi:hypothetical protein